MTVYILPECGCKVGMQIVPKAYPSSRGDYSGRFEKKAWIEHTCEMHTANMKDEYLNDVREELNTAN